MPHCDVVIIGAGVIGSSIAYHLGKRGMRSTVVERESIGTRASGKAWAVIAYPPTLLAETDGAPQCRRRCCRRPRRDAGKRQPWKTGSTSSRRRTNECRTWPSRSPSEAASTSSTASRPTPCFFTEAEIEKEGRDGLLAPYRRAGGIETGWLDAAQLREVFPSLESKWVAGITNPEGQVEPYKFTLGLAQAAERLGARMKQGEAVGFATRGDRITGLKLAAGDVLEADHFVIAGGPWSRPVASHLGVDIPMRLLMTECIRVGVPGGLPFQTLVAGDYWIIPKVNGEVILSPYDGLH